MLLSKMIMGRIGSKVLLLVAFLTYALRWFLFSLISNPTAALGVQLLHGLSFAAFLVGGITYINECTPEGLNTNAQALFNSITIGLGAIVGTLPGGYLYDRFGMTTLFQTLTLVTVVALIVFWLGSRSHDDMSISASGA